MNNLNENGTIELKPGIYDLSNSEAILMNKNVMFKGVKTILTNGVIKVTNKNVKYGINISPESMYFTISNMNILI
jgi:hypothetical protein